MRAEEREHNLDDLLAREPVFAVTTDIDWASDYCIAHLLDAFEMFQVKPTIFMTHETARCSSAALQDKAELAIHPNFLPNSTHGCTPAEVVSHIKSIVPSARGSRGHAYATSSHIIKALRSSGIRYDSGPMSYLTEGLIPLRHGSGLVHYPVFWEDDAHWEVEEDWEFARFRPLFETPGLKVIDVHPFFFALNVPNNDYYVQRKNHITALTEDDAVREAYPGRGCASFTRELLSFVSTSRYRCLTLGELYDWQVGT